MRVLGWACGGDSGCVKPRLLQAGDAEEKMPTAGLRLCVVEAGGVDDVDFVGFGGCGYCVFCFLAYVLVGVVQKCLE